MDRLLRRLNAWLKKARGLPIIGGMADDLMTVARLLSDYARGVYRDLPRGTVLALTAAILYLLLPIDLILDVVPFVGYLDDAAILGLMLDLGLARDLVRYRGWRANLTRRQQEFYRAAQTAHFRGLLGKDRLAAAFLTGDKAIRLLVCRETETRPPLRCRAVTEHPDLATLAKMDVESWEELGAFYTAVFSDPELPWSALGPRPFMPEYDPRAKSDDFIIEN